VGTEKRPICSKGPQAQTQASYSEDPQPTIDICSGLKVVKCYTFRGTVQLDDHRNDRPPVGLSGADNILLPIFQLQHNMPKQNLSFLRAFVSNLAYFTLGNITCKPPDWA